MDSQPKNDGYPHTLRSVFWTKSSYAHFARSFHPYHKHDLNALAHVFTTGLGVWGTVQLAGVVLDPELAAISVWAYAAIVAATTPVVTAFFHTAFVYGCLRISIEDAAKLCSIPLEAVPGGALGACALAIAAGYGLQDLAHWLCAEKTLMSSYIRTSPSTLLVHTFWLMPLVIDSVLMRHCFIPKLFVNRNRNIFCQVASKKAVEDLREWINQEVPEKPVSACNRRCFVVAVLFTAVVRGLGFI